MYDGGGKTPKGTYTYTKVTYNWTTEDAQLYPADVKDTNQEYSITTLIVVEMFTHQNLTWRHHLFSSEFGGGAGWGWLRTSQTWEHLNNQWERIKEWLYVRASVDNSARIFRSLKRIDALRCSE